MTIVEKKLSSHRNNIDYIQKKIDLGCSFFDVKKVDAADAAFAEALSRATSILEGHPGNSEYQIVMAETYHLLALGYMHCKDYNKARLHILKAFEALTKSKVIDPWYEVTLRSSLARIEQVSKHHRKALQILEEVNRFCRENGFLEIKEDGFLYADNMIALATGYMAAGDYPMMVKGAKEVIALRNKYPNGHLSLHADEYLPFLSLLENEASKIEDHAFRHSVLEEAIEYCEESKKRGIWFNILKESEFYQHLLHQDFLNRDREAMERTYRTQIQLCDENPTESMNQVRIITHLNYAVYCSILKEAEKARQAVEDGIGCCMELKDDGSIEHILFIVSALSTLANLGWDNGDLVGALRELDSEIEILSNYAKQHPQQLHKILPIQMDALFNQSVLRYELGKGILAEQDIKRIKDQYRVDPDKATKEELATALTVMKRCGDIHHEVEKHQKALEEYQEALYLIENTDEDSDEIKMMLNDIHNDLNNSIMLEKQELKHRNF